MPSVISVSNNLLSGPLFCELCLPLILLNLFTVIFSTEVVIQSKWVSSPYTRTWKLIQNSLWKYRNKQFMGTKIRLTLSSISQNYCHYLPDVHCFAHHFLICYVCFCCVWQEIKFGPCYFNLTGV